MSLKNALETAKEILAQHSEDQLDETYMEAEEMKKAQKPVEKTKTFLLTQKVTVKNLPMVLHPKPSNPLKVVNSEKPILVKRSLVISKTKKRKSMVKAKKPKRWKTR